MEAAVSDGNNIIDFLGSEGYIRFKADYEVSSKDLYAVYKIGTRIGVIVVPVYFLHLGKDIAVLPCKLDEFLPSVGIVIEHVGAERNTLGSMHIVCGVL